MAAEGPPAADPGPAARAKALEAAIDEATSQVKALREKLEADGTFEKIRAAMADAPSREEMLARAEQLAATTVNVLLGGMVIALVVSMLLAWRLSVFLMRPLKELTASVAAIGKGDLDRAVPERSGDELGQLARAFNQMSAKLRAYREATLAKVLRTQRTMEATLSSAPDPVFVLDADGTHAVRNPAAERLAQSPDFPASFPPGITGPLAQVMATGDHYLPTDYRHIVTFRVAREEHHYLPRILAIGDKVTDFKGAAIILQDVTKFRLLDDAKTNLAGTVSHELKTPLTSLRLAVYLLLEENVGALAPAQRELLETARDDADRLLRILDSLLDLSRLEAGAVALDRVEVHPKEGRPDVRDVDQEDRDDPEPYGRVGVQ
jgi:nitrogen fixation/metabolism regulation signal transduction histidine kinase